MSELSLLSSQVKINVISDHQSCIIHMHTLTHTQHTLFFSLMFFRNKSAFSNSLGEKEVAECCQILNKLYDKFFN